MATSPAHNRVFKKRFFRKTPSDQISCGDLSDPLYWEHGDAGVRRAVKFEEPGNRDDHSRVIKKRYFRKTPSDQNSCADLAASGGTGVRGKKRADCEETESDLPDEKEWINALDRSLSAEEAAPADAPDCSSSADGNFSCCFCGGHDAPFGNDLGLCDGCDRGFHQACHTPPVADFGALGESWFCASCIEVATRKKALSCASPKRKTRDNHSGRRSPSAKTTTPLKSEKSHDGSSWTRACRQKLVSKLHEELAASSKAGATVDGLFLPFEDSFVCCVCGGTDAPEGNDLALCDACNCGYHQQCHQPVVQSFGGVNDGSWFCIDCSKKAKRKNRRPRRSRVSLSHRALLKLL